MWTKLIESDSMKKYERALDASALRQNLLNQNLANVNTPYYKRLDIDFKSVFATEIDKNELQMKNTHPRHYSNSIPVQGPLKVTREIKTDERYDKNNIDPEFEMAQVAENSLYFQACAQRLKGKFSGLKTVIQGR
jgi:flagellar basal-body rod protein FlgB